MRTTTLFPSFRLECIAVASGIDIYAIIGGSGPPLLLLHGHPQTHAIWHRVAPVLAQHFTVVAIDLRGYGDSSKPPGDADHANYSKRTMAQDALTVKVKVSGLTFGHGLSHHKGTG